MRLEELAQAAPLVPLVVPDQGVPVVHQAPKVSLVSKVNVGSMALLEQLDLGVSTATSVPRGRPVQQDLRVTLGRKGQRDHREIQGRVELKVFKVHQESEENQEVRSKASTDLDQLRSMPDCGVFMSTCSSADVIVYVLICDV